MLRHPSPGTQHPAPSTREKISFKRSTARKSPRFLKLCHENELALREETCLEKSVADLILLTLGDKLRLHNPL